MHAELLDKIYGSEMNVIGAMMASKSSLEQVLKELTWKNFHFCNFHKIFIEMEFLYRNNKEIDIHSVANQLKEDNWLKEIGGIERLVQVVQYAGLKDIDEDIKLLKEQNY